MDKSRSRYVQDVFERIAPRYDLMNRLMTGGQDLAWRREVVRRARLFPGARLLDLGAGTGDLGREALRQAPDARVTLADFSTGMMHIGQQRPGPGLSWSAADALNLPFPNASFDVVISGFLLRNVASLPEALGEQLRVLKPGGRVVALDTTRPVRSLLTPFIWTHMHLVIPALGWLISGQRDAYRYLPNSTESFLKAEDLAMRMNSAGFRQVGFRRLNFGTIAIHWGQKG
jgi:demethylmenaquinone methyltransferase / 2-methoxy-6-polyprenyl-1,4-benzoquinol methylase